MEKFESADPIKEALVEKLEFARRNSLPYAEIVKIIDRETELSYLNTEEASVERKMLGEKLKNATVTVYTLPEFKLLLEQTDINPKRALDALAHENAHANAAESLGATDISYNLVVGRGEDRWMYDVYVSFTDPAAGSEAEEIRNRIKILSAPEEYDGSPSGDDIERVRLLKEKLSR